MGFCRVKLLTLVNLNAPIPSTPDLPRELRDRMGIESFIIALDDPEFELKMRERTPQTLSDALTLATSLEGWMIDARKRMALANQENAKSDDVNPLRHTKGKQLEPLGEPRLISAKHPLPSEWTILRRM